MTRAQRFGIITAVLVGWLSTTAYALDDALLLRLDILNPALNGTVQAIQPALLTFGIGLFLGTTLGARALANRKATSHPFRIVAVPVAGLGLAIATLALVGPLGLAQSYDALHEPKSQPVSQMEFAPTEWIISVERNGDETIYPLDLLEQHLAINDRVGGKPVLVTWCFSCTSPMAYRAASSERELSFDVVGIHEIDAILEDRETRTWWDEGTGEAVGGPLQGERLERIPAMMVQWRHWQGNPDRAQVAVPSAAAH